MLYFNLGRKGCFTAKSAEKLPISRYPAIIARQFQDSHWKPRIIIKIKSGARHTNV
jgi:hypothetical protein